jgi:hypothetical protein
MHTVYCLIIASTRALLLSERIAFMNQEKIIGTWKLVSQVSHEADGSRSNSRGENAAGLLMYAPSGYMSVYLARTDALAPQYLDLSTEQTALEGFVAYFGRFELDEPSQTVAHLVEGCSYRAWIGQRLVRAFTFSEANGEQYLTLTASKRVGGDMTRRVLVWRRES